MISGIEPTIIKLNNFWLFFRLNKSFLKKYMIANKDPRWRLISINNEPDLNSYKLDTIIRCADELIGKNSDMPWMAESIKTSIMFCSILST